MSNSKYPSDTFCILPWIHLSTRPDGSMRVCCTANASSVGPTNDKEQYGQVGVLKQMTKTTPNVSDFLSSWNSNYMKRPGMSTEKNQLFKVLQRRSFDITVSMGNSLLGQAC